MVEGKDDEAVMYGISEKGFGCLRIVTGVDRLIYNSGTNLEEGHRLSTIEHTIYSKICLQITIDLLDLDVNPLLYYCILGITSVLKSTRILLT